MSIKKHFHQLFLNLLRMRNIEKENIPEGHKSKIILISWTATRKNTLHGKSRLCDSGRYRVYSGKYKEGKKVIHQRYLISHKLSGKAPFMD